MKKMNTHKGRLNRDQWKGQEEAHSASLEQEGEDADEIGQPGGRDELAVLHQLHSERLHVRARAQVVDPGGHNHSDKCERSTSCARGRGVRVRCTVGEKHQIKTLAGRVIVPCHCT